MTGDRVNGQRTTDNGQRATGNGQATDGYNVGAVATTAIQRQVEHSDGRVELIDTSRVERSVLYNEDLAPVPVARRTWTTYNYAALWISMAHCIPTYMLSAGLMAAGMSWAQALFTVALGNTIVLIPILLNSHPGTKYGIPFPVFARAAYGTIGSNLPALMRAIVACGWFGIQAWIGGEALHTFFASVVPNWQALLGGGFQGHTTTEWISFLLFWGLNIGIIYKGMDLLREVETMDTFGIPATKAYRDHPLWKKDPKTAVFPDTLQYARQVGYAGPAGRKATEALTKYIMVDMFAKAIQGMRAEDAVAWASGEMKKIYGG